jgi:hypothetical protein
MGLFVALVFVRIYWYEWSILSFAWSVFVLPRTRLFVTPCLLDRYPRFVTIRVVFLLLCIMSGRLSFAGLGNFGNSALETYTPCSVLECFADLDVFG